ncbi:MAG TPA: glycosyltransferase [Thermoanaerobaculia bacterium]
MKVIHWSMLNGSGMNRVAASMARGELAIGVDARLLDPFDTNETGWEIALDADIHVNHTHIPEKIGGKPFRAACTKPFRYVFPVHGTPEHVFESTIADAAQNGYNTGTSYAHHQNGMQEADAVVTFWERHQWLYQLALDKHSIVDLVPMGIDTAFWNAGVMRGKYAGEPSFLSCENQHPFKWSFYILRMWKAIRRELPYAVLHVANIPGGVQRFVDAMAARYGCANGCVYGSWAYKHEDLRNILKSVDYYISPVRYGDHNRMSLEAAATGAKVISYVGNRYADFWIPEGDDRRQAEAIIDIGRGNVEPRADKLPVPTEVDMARAMVNVYERILDRPQTNWSMGGLPDALPTTIRAAIASAQGIRDIEDLMKPRLTLLTDAAPVAPADAASVPETPETPEVAG